MPSPSSANCPTFGVTRPPSPQTHTTSYVTATLRPAAPYVSPMEVSTITSSPVPSPSATSSVRTTQQQYLVTSTHYPLTLLMTNSTAWDLPPKTGEWPPLASPWLQAITSQYSTTPKTLTTLTPAPTTPSMDPAPRALSHHQPSPYHSQPPRPSPAPN